MGFVRPQMPVEHFRVLGYNRIGGRSIFDARLPVRRAGLANLLESDYKPVRPEPAEGSLASGRKPSTSSGRTALWTSLKKITKPTRSRGKVDWTPRLIGAKAKQADTRAQYLRE